MFNGFTDETVQYLLDLKFHNNSDFFHATHDRYVETVQTPFYKLIEDLSPDMRKIDPLMEPVPDSPGYPVFPGQKPVPGPSLVPVQKSCGTTGKEPDVLF